MKAGPAHRIGSISGWLGHTGHFSKFYITTFFYLDIFYISLGPYRKFSMFGPALDEGVDHNVNTIQNSEYLLFGTIPGYM